MDIALQALFIVAVRSVGSFSHASVVVFFPLCVVFACVCCVGACFVLACMCMCVSMMDFGSKIRD